MAIDVHEILNFHLSLHRRARAAPPQIIFGMIANRRQWCLWKTVALLYRVTKIGANLADVCWRFIPSRSEKWWEEREKSVAGENDRKSIHTKQTHTAIVRENCRLWIVSETKINDEMIGTIEERLHCHFPCKSFSPLYSSEFPLHFVLSNGWTEFYFGIWFVSVEVFAPVSR